MSRRRNRRQERGAAMVESLLVVPLLILIDVALVYMYSAYDTRLATMRSARSESWSYAMSACESPGEMSSLDGTDPSLAPLQGSLTRAQTLAVGPSLMAPLAPKLDIGAASSVKTSKGSNLVDQFTSRTITTHSRVLCNEKPSSITDLDRRATIHTLYGRLL